jgi:phage gp36-like protein
MAYCTQQNMIDRFGEEELIQLTDRAGAGTIDAAVVQQAIDDAGGEIDGYVSAAGHALPLDPVPRILTAYACDIARYRLYDDAATEQVTRRYDDAIKFLRNLAQGVVSLGISGAEGTAGTADFDGGRQVFGGGGF